MQITHSSFFYASIFIYLGISLAILFGCKSKISPNSSTSNSELVGTWEVIESSFVPFEHISFCDTLGIGSTFQFKKDGVLNVYYKDHLKKCNGEQSYVQDSNTIKMQEWDMLFDYEIKKLVTDTLILNIRRVPSYIFKDSLDIVFHSEINISESNFYTRIKKEGIRVLLTKKNGK